MKKEDKFPHFVDNLPHAAHTTSEFGREEYPEIDPERSGRGQQADGGKQSIVLGIQEVETVGKNGGPEHAMLLLQLQ